MEQGQIYRVSGPVVTAVGIAPKMYDVVFVGEKGLMGEVIEIAGNKSIIQVYEPTEGIRPGEKVLNSGKPLVLELGPGMLTTIYDGIQRPLVKIKEQAGDFITRGISVTAIDRKKKWDFVPTAKKGDKIDAGQELGYVQETKHIKHYILAPHGVSGELKEISSGKFNVEEQVALVGNHKVSMMHTWPVREARPIREKLMPTVPLITGQRILDAFFPIAKGGTGCIPGPFGSGKTVTQHQLARWSDTEIVVYVGCGERGNEMTEVLTEFPELTDPKTGAPLMERTILIANTSNMPVAAREASIYTGITMAEYYRDMGYDVSIMADSTSRWAEAMREISSRLEEMPGEEGYPAYLASKLSAFYERSGRVKTLGGKHGSVTVVGAVSPPGGDFSEPVTQNTLRIVKVFWALDEKLANSRHFPAINWLTSYSLYSGMLSNWMKENVADDWPSMREKAMGILQKEAELKEIVQLVGSDALPEREQLTLEIARMIREFFLQQNAYHPIDSFCPMKNQYALLKTILEYGDLAYKTLDKGATIKDIFGIKAREELGRSRFEKDFESNIVRIAAQIREELSRLGG